ncbi:DUF3408 domain-containing protein [Bacteroides thetaiotaomicron]|uniref:DUF3408 domain-containing protein n=1 Tax=Bacteroides thetaiotaomicron TaxID=818 RepID=UPI001C8B5409|nr:DUF3408 domain-containing protein [Bacteroides thetaiotaomicron]MBX9049621.1 DUF3408 domain-containing protein [Bacteroides thetaiotaomicron]MBX9072953.1 DUF3408 domain-containing protein [Bacteroides thetaiotaomicron]
MAKKVLADIDENFIISSFKQTELPPPQQPPPEPATESPPQREEPRKRRGKAQEDYQTLFMKEATIPARIGKTVYIRKEYHDRIQKIVRVIGEDQVSLFSYIDNVLAQHFASYQEEITELYNQKNESIF